MKHKEWEKMFLDFLKNKERMMTVEEIAKGLLLNRIVVTKYMRRLAVKGEVRAQEINNEICWGAT